MDNFAQLWYPDFIGIAYLYDPKELVICPYFSERGKAKYVYEKILAWNSNFIKIRFLEYDSDNYAFFAYQDPKGSFEKFNFGLYRSWMKIQGNYSRFKPKLDSNCKLGILYLKDPQNFNDFELLGDPIAISDCKILSNDELDLYPIEKWAHHICQGKSDVAPPF